MNSGNSLEKLSREGKLKPQRTNTDLPAPSAFERSSFTTLLTLVPADVDLFIVSEDKQKCLGTATAVFAVH